jgi:DNA polymerase-3 subunit gamma/tau
VPTLIIFWQLILKVLDELKIVSSQILSLEMLIIRLVHLKGMPSYDNIIESLKINNSNQLEDNNTKINLDNDKKNFLNEEKEITQISKDQIKNITQTKPILSNLNIKKILKDPALETVLSIDDLIFLSSKKKEVQLKYDLENNVNLIKFSERKIDISFNERLDKNFVRNLSEKLLEWTGKRWVITLSKQQGQISFLENRKVEKKKLIDIEKTGETYKKFKNIFSDGELLEINKDD